MPNAAPSPIVIVGPGRLGRTVASWLAEAGVDHHLVGRGETVPPAPLTWLTVPDRAIADAAARVPRGGVVLHASGATGLEPLRPHSPAGSLHPLMTFPGPELGVPDRDDLPAAVAGDPEARAAARALAATLGFRVFDLPGDRRLYHAAAVMAGNFATALLAQAAEVLAGAGVPPEDAPALLAPLARQSLANAARGGPARTLTGPVARGDEAVISAHRAALNSLDPSLAHTYETLLDATRTLVGPVSLPPATTGAQDTE